LSDIKISKSRRLRWIGNVACMGDEKHKILVRKPEEQRPFKRPRCK
jgi:hypothetical protein